jgi:antitoxin component YwqK of YwqJK toxin-antitoxin module|tara:strand:+ start:161 stop:322 length:162 start_codon:yes stop_codon:yes gene_type:complete
LVEEFYDNGQLKRSGNWKNGKENRLWETFYKYGQPSQKMKLQKRRTRRPLGVF